MTSETIPCPRCARPTSPELDACEHCGDAIVGDSTSGDLVARNVLLVVGLMAGALAVIGGAYAAYLGRTAPSEALEIVPSAVAWLAIAGLCLLAYRRYGSDGTEEA